MTVGLAGKSIVLEANDLRHRVLSYGAPDAQPVLLLPGITSPAGTADFLATRIADLGFAVIVPDIRGRGDTDTPPPGNYRLQDYAADVHGIVRELGLVAPIVIGHSMGARIAAAYAVDHAGPEHNLIVLVDPPLSGPGRDPYPTGLDSFMAQLNEAKAGTTVEAVRRFYPKWPERELLLRIELLPTCDETAVRETHAGFEQEDFFPYWRHLAPPTVLLYGADSPVVTAAGVADLAEANPDIPRIAIPEAGHMIPWDNFDGFFKELAPLLTRTAGQGGR
ncbi:MAG: alpha/beta hydrolase [Bauldia litoralis]